MSVEVINLIKYLVRDRNPDGNFEQINIETVAEKQTEATEEHQDETKPLDSA